MLNFWRENSKFKCDYFPITEVKNLDFNRGKFKYFFAISFENLAILNFNILNFPIVSRHKIGTAKCKYYNMLEGKDRYLLVDITYLLVTFKHQ